MSPGMLKPGLACPTCGLPVIMVFHSWNSGQGTAEFEYHHAVEHHAGPQGATHTVVYSYDEGLEKAKEESAMSAQDYAADHLSGPEVDPNPTQGVPVPAEAQMIGEMLSAIELRQIMQVERDAAQEIMDTCSDRLKANMMALGFKQADSPTWRAQLITQNRETLNKVKLVNAGVPVTVIEACTDTKATISLRVIPRPKD